MTQSTDPRQKKTHGKAEDALQHISSCQTRLLELCQCDDVDPLFDQVEILLDDETDFSFLRLYLTDKEGNFTLARSLCPEDTPLDWTRVEQACRDQEMAIIPHGKNTPQSTLILPLTGQSATLGVLVLWLEPHLDMLSQEKSVFLKMLTHHIATFLETRHLRRHVQAANRTVRDVVESIPIGIMELDKQQRITVINSTMEFMLDIKRDAVLGQSICNALPPFIASVITQALNPDEQGEQELDIDMQGFTANLSITSTPIGPNIDGLPAGQIILCRNVHLSHEIIKLRELDAIKNDFLSMVTHELRSPLTSIMAYSETLLMEDVVDTEEKRQKYLRTIYSEGKRLNRLINDILDMTKLEAGKVDYAYKQQAIQDPIEQAISSTTPLAEEKNITIKTHLADNMPTVRCDADRLIQVLTNLLSNSIKFSREGGVIIIHAQSKPPFENKTISTVEIAVQDSGIGIAQEDLNKVFRKFEQIKHADHPTRGTGLGMSICKQIIENGHAGKIWIESEVGVGTTVFFRIPTT